jgi:hypothetical protein
MAHISTAAVTILATNSGPPKMDLADTSVGGVATNVPTSGDTVQLSAVLGLAATITMTLLGLSAVAMFGGKPLRESARVTLLAWLRLVAFAVGYIVVGALYVPIIALLQIERLAPVLGPMAMRAIGRGQRRQRADSDVSVMALDGEEGHGGKDEMETGDSVC